MFSAIKRKFSRYKTTAETLDDEQSITIDTTSKPVTARKKFHGFFSEVRDDGVHYFRESGLSSFIDQGKRVSVCEHTKEDVVLAALHLANAKADELRSQGKGDAGLTINGNDEFKQLCARLAARHGFKINNPELQDLIQTERDRIAAAAPTIAACKDAKLEMPEPQATTPIERQSLLETLDFQLVQDELTKEIKTDTAERHDKDLALAAQQQASAKTLGHHSPRPGM